MYGRRRPLEGIIAITSIARRKEHPTMSEQANVPSMILGGSRTKPSVYSVQKMKGQHRNRDQQ
jgi:hypothetical protein